MDAYPGFTERHSEVAVDSSDTHFYSGVMNIVSEDGEMCRDEWQT